MNIKIFYNPDNLDNLATLAFSLHRGVQAFQGVIEEILVTPLYPDPHGDEQEVDWASLTPGIPHHLGEIRGLSMSDYFRILNRECVNSPCGRFALRLAWKEEIEELEQSIAEETRKRMGEADELFADAIAEEEGN